MFLASLSFRHLSITRRKTLALQKQSELKLFWNTHRRMSHYRRVNRGTGSTLFLKIAWQWKLDIRYRFNNGSPASTLGWFGVFSMALGQHLCVISHDICRLTVSSRSCWGQTQMWVGDRGGGEHWWGFGPACSPFCLLLLGSLVGLFVYRWALPTPAHRGLIGT